MQYEEEFKKRFLDLWWRSQVLGDQTVICGALLARYQEPGRDYRNVRHIVECSRELDDLRPLLPRAEIITSEWSLFYHDSYCRVLERRCELKSAEIFQSDAVKISLARKIAIDSFSGILYTDHHHQPLDRAAQVTVDCDKAILGQGVDRHYEYLRDTMREYVTHGGVPLERYIKGRIELFLEPFLARRRIFSTEHFRKKYEARAQHNLATELREMRNPAWLSIYKTWVAVKEV